MHFFRQKHPLFEPEKRVKLHPVQNDITMVNEYCLVENTMVISETIDLIDTSLAQNPPLLINCQFAEFFH